MPAKTGAHYISGLSQRPAEVWIRGERIEDVAIVGDSMVDFETASNAKMRFIGVTWGIGTVEKKVQKKSDWIIDSPEELRKIFFD